MADDFFLVFCPAFDTVRVFLPCNDVYCLVFILSVGVMYIRFFFCYCFFATRADVVFIYCARHMVCNCYKYSVLPRGNTMRFVLFRTASSDRGCFLLCTQHTHILIFKDLVGKSFNSARRSSHRRSQ